MSLEAIKFDEKAVTLTILDQLLIPYKSEYINVNDITDGFNVIKKMQVRGAPAIAIVGCLSIVVELHLILVKKGELSDVSYDETNLASFKKTLLDRIEYLITSRPTAVNLLNGCTEIIKVINSSQNVHEIYEKVTQYTVSLFKEDLINNHRLSDNGLHYIHSSLAQEGFKGPYSVLTICNTGSLATAGRGTALGIIRSLWEASKLNVSEDGKKTAKQESVGESTWLEHVYACETRPYNQGSRLTAYELNYEKIPFSLITDNMVSFLVDSLAKAKTNRDLPSMAPIKFIIVGADRIVSNGDLANKIGTFQLSLIAHNYPSIKFIGAAPRTTIDFNKQSGDEIVIEQRPQIELTTVMGAQVDLKTGAPLADKQVELCRVQLAPSGINAWNPSFDVTPHEYIDCIVTEGLSHIKKNGEFDLHEKL